MSYRSILVQVDDSGPGWTRVRAAASVAAAFGARLTGLFLKSDRIPTYVVGDGLVMPSVNIDSYLEERAEETARASGRAKTTFREAAAQSGADLTWLEVNGDTDSALAACARRHDLTVVPAEMSPAFSDHVISAARIGMSNGGPLLIVPERGFPANFGGNVLVAWNDSRESARALRDAMPFLRKAKSIHFVVAGQQEGNELDPMLQSYLASHDCGHAKLVVDREEGASAGDLIRRRIDMVGADLVVMGLYGHSRLQELVLGGVTRTLLQLLPMPLLVSH